MLNIPIVYCFKFCLCYLYCHVKLLHCVSSGVSAGLNPDDRLPVLLCILQRVQDPHPELLLHSTPPPDQRTQPHLHWDVGKAVVLTIARIIATVIPREKCTNYSCMPRAYACLQKHAHMHTCMLACMHRMCACTYTCTRACMHVHIHNTCSHTCIHAHTQHTHTHTHNTHTLSLSLFRNHHILGAIFIIFVPISPGQDAVSSHSTHVSELPGPDSSGQSRDPWLRH